MWSLARSEVCDPLSHLIRSQRSPRSLPLCYRKCRQLWKGREEAASVCRGGALCPHASWPKPSLPSAWPLEDLGKQSPTPPSCVCLALSTGTPVMPTGPGSGFLLAAMDIFRSHTRFQKETPSCKN